MAIFQDYTETVGDVCTITVTSKTGNEYVFRAETLDAARDKAEAFKSGYRAGALDASNAALAVST